MDRDDEEPQRKRSKLDFSMRQVDLSSDGVLN